MSLQLNPLHQRIGAILNDLLKDKKNVLLLKDKACGGNQHIPLFCTSKKLRETEYCNVDLMILKNNKISVIIEIEESNIKPTQVCGKFLTSALSRFYIHESNNYKPIGMDSSVSFIQVLDTSKLKGNTRKLRQWDLLETSINSILPLEGSLISKYFLLKGAISDFNNDSSPSKSLISIAEKSLI